MKKQRRVFERFVILLLAFFSVSVFTSAQAAYRGYGHESTKLEKWAPRDSGERFFASPGKKIKVWFHPGDGVAASDAVAGQSRDKVGLIAVYVNDDGDGAIESGEVVGVEKSATSITFADKVAMPSDVALDDTLIYTHVLLFIAPYESNGGGALPVDPQRIGSDTSETPETKGRWLMPLNINPNLKGEEDSVGPAIRVIAGDSSAIISFHNGSVTTATKALFGKVDKVVTTDSGDVTIKVDGEVLASLIEQSAVLNQYLIPIKSSYKGPALIDAVVSPHTDGTARTGEVFLVFSTLLEAITAGNIGDPLGAGAPLNTASTGLALLSGTPPTYAASVTATTSTATLQNAAVAAGTNIVTLSLAHGDNDPFTASVDYMAIRVDDASVNSIKDEAGNFMDSKTGISIMAGGAYYNSATAFIPVRESAPLKLATGGNIVPNVLLVGSPKMGDNHNLFKEAEGDPYSLEGVDITANNNDELVVRIYFNHPVKPSGATFVADSVPTAIADFLSHAFQLKFKPKINLEGINAVSANIQLATDNQETKVGSSVDLTSGSAYVNHYVDVGWKVVDTEFDRARIHEDGLQLRAKKSANSLMQERWYFLEVFIPGHASDTIRDVAGTSIPVHVGVGDDATAADLEQEYTSSVVGVSEIVVGALIEKPSVSTADNNEDGFVDGVLIDYKHNIVGFFSQASLNNLDIASIPRKGTDGEEIYITIMQEITSPTQVRLNFDLDSINAPVGGFGDDYKEYRSGAQISMPYASLTNGESLAGHAKGEKLPFMVQSEDALAYDLSAFTVINSDSRMKIDELPVPRIERTEEIIDGVKPVLLRASYKPDPSVSEGTVSHENTLVFVFSEPVKGLTDKIPPPGYISIKERDSRSIPLSMYYGRFFSSSVKIRGKLDSIDNKIDLAADRGGGKNVFEIKGLNKYKENAGLTIHVDGAAHAIQISDFSGNTLASVPSLVVLEQRIPSPIRLLGIKDGVRLEKLIIQYSDNIEIADLTVTKRELAGYFKVRIFNKEGVYYDYSPSEAILLNPQLIKLSLTAPVNPEDYVLVSYNGNVLISEDDTPLATSDDSGFFKYGVAVGAIVTSFDTSAVSAWDKYVQKYHQGGASLMVGDKVYHPYGAHGMISTNVFVESESSTMMGLNVQFMKGAVMMGGDAVSEHSLIKAGVFIKKPDVSTLRGEITTSREERGSTLEFETSAQERIDSAGGRSVKTIKLYVNKKTDGSMTAKYMLSDSPGKISWPVDVRIEGMRLTLSSAGNWYLRGTAYMEEGIKNIGAQGAFSHAHTTTDGNYELLVATDFPSYKDAFIMMAINRNGQYQMLTSAVQSAANYVPFKNSFTAAFDRAEQLNFDLEALLTYKVRLMDKGVQVVGLPGFLNSGIGSARIDWERFIFGVNPQGGGFHSLWQSFENPKAAYVWGNRTYEAYKYQSTSGKVTVGNVVYGQLRNAGAFLLNLGKEPSSVLTGVKEVRMALPRVATTTVSLSRGWNSVTLRGQNFLESGDTNDEEVAAIFTVTEEGVLKFWLSGRGSGVSPRDVISLGDGIPVLLYLKSRISNFDFFAEEE